MKKILRGVAIAIISIAYGFFAGGGVAQIGLRFAPAIFTTLVGTAIVIVAMVFAGLWIAGLLKQLWKPGIKNIGNASILAES